MQGDGPFPDGISVTIRRNYIYEDAYDKLCPENGTAADQIKYIIRCVKYASFGRLAVLFSEVQEKRKQQMLLKLLFCSIKSYH